MSLKGPLLPKASEDSIPTIDSSEGLPDVNEWKQGDLVVINFAGSNNRLAIRKNSSNEWIPVESFGTYTRLNLGYGFFSYKGDITPSFGNDYQSVTFSHQRNTAESGTATPDFGVNLYSTTYRASTVYSYDTYNSIDSDGTQMRIFIGDSSDGAMEHAHIFDTNTSSVQQVARKQVGGGNLTSYDSGSLNDQEEAKGNIIRIYSDQKTTDDKLSFGYELERPNKASGSVSAFKNYGLITPPPSSKFVSYSSSGTDLTNLEWKLNFLEIKV